MENSTNSMIKAPINNSTKTISTSDQYSLGESSWTMYLEDFLLQNNNEYCNSLISSSYNESSLISDASSSAINAKKMADNEEIDERFGMNIINRNGNRLSFKKRKTKEAVLLDDSLEDTASSPLNSPKVLNLSQLGVKPKDKDDVMITNMFENKLGSSASSGQIDHERRDEQLSYTGKDSDCTELKKKGLCLVPLSMLLNYLG